MACPADFSDAECSGRGVCVQKDLCDCAQSPGWSGVGDFVFSEPPWGPSCAVFLPATAALWALLLISSAFNLTIIVFALAGRARLYRDGWTKTFTFLHLRGFVDVGQIVLASLRVARPVETIGSSWAPTVLFIAAFQCTVIVVALFFSILMQMHASIVVDARSKARLRFLVRAMPAAIGVPYALAHCIVLSMPLYQRCAKRGG